jgi:hypothetical protein
MDGGSESSRDIYIFSGDPTQEPWNIPARGSATSNDEEGLEYIAGLILRNDCQALIIKYEEKTISSPANVRVVMIVPATVADITAGQSLNAHRVSIGTVASTHLCLVIKRSYPSRLST